MHMEAFALERWMTTWETKVGYDIAESGIWPMTVSDVLSLVPSDERKDLTERFLNQRLGYSEAQGSHELRSLLADTYVAQEPENILVTTGAIEANFLAFSVLLNPGDHVVAVHPAYQQLYSAPKGLGCDVSFWRLRAENGFRFDLDELRKLVKRQTKLIVINSPHNPTGAMLAGDDLATIYDLADTFGARVLSDEAYRWLELPGGDQLPPPMRNFGDRAISVGTFSKPFGLPGLRIGWLAGPAELVKRCWHLRDYVSLSPGRLGDFLAVIALQHRDEIFQRTRSLVSENLQTARDWFAAHADVVSWTPPRAGLLSLIQYTLDIGSLQLAERLAERHSVMLAPGAAFGIEYHLRIGIGQQPDIFREALNRTAQCLAELRAGGIAPRRDFHNVI